MDEHNIKERKDFRVDLLTQFLYVGMFSAMYQSVLILFIDGKEYLIVAISFAIVIGLLILINKIGYHNFARLGSFIIINLSLFFVCKLLPDSGIQYYYFQLILLSFILYGSTNRVKAIIFAILPILLFILNLVEVEKIKTFAMIINFMSSGIIVNFSTAAIVTSVAIIYLMNSNQKINNSLIESNLELSNVSNELKINNKILAKTNSELDKFLYSSSHDLRAPLTSILGLVNLAKLEPLEKHGMYMEMIRDKVIGLDYFIKELIDFSKNSNTDLRYEIIDVHELIDLCVEKNRYMPGGNEVKLLLDVETLKIKSDFYRLSSILTSLIGNAIKYHDFNRDQPMLWISVTGSNPVSFSVRDNGIGINKLIKPNIFDMFYRGSELSSGSGLGLYIASEMLNSLKGTFEVTSQEGKGSTFKFYLPVPD